MDIIYQLIPILVLCLEQQFYINHQLVVLHIKLLLLLNNNAKNVILVIHFIKVTQLAYGNAVKIVNQIYKIIYANLVYIITMFIDV